MEEVQVNTDIDLQIKYPSFILGDTSSTMLPTCQVIIIIKPSTIFASATILDFIAFLFEQFLT